MSNKTLTLSDFAFKAEKRDTTVEVTIAATTEGGVMSDFGAFTMETVPNNAREVERAVANYIREKILAESQDRFEYVGTLRRF